MRWLMWLMVFLSAPASARTDPVIDIADPLVEIRSFFSGADIFVFGATDCTPPSCDILVRVEGPPTPAVVRKKEKIAGIWINGQSRTFTHMPGYSGIASTRALKSSLPLEGYIAFDPQKPQLSHTKTEQDFLASLIDEKVRSGLYQLSPSDVIVQDGRLFRARLAAPAAVPTGQYSISVIIVEDKVVTGRAQTQLIIKKAGFEAFVSDAARAHPFAYAIISVLFALSIGFISTTLFTRR
ncbi:MAG: TIGR02186 family protein [Pseudomonadota bacterium]